MADISKALKVVRQLNPLGLFSKATEEASRIPQAKGTGEQMRAALLKQGVKPEELRWTGFDEWAKGKKSVTRDEVAEFLKKNEVQVGETRLGDNARAAEKRVNELENIRQDRRLTDAEEGEYRRLVNVLNSDNAPVTKFEKWTLPGGENYREVLLTRPRGDRSALDAAEQRARDTERAAADAMANWKRISEQNTPGHPETLEAYKVVDATRREREAAKTELRALHAAEDQQVYRSSHWDEPDVLAHLRMTEREVPTQGFKVVNRRYGTSSSTFGSLEEAQAHLARIPGSNPADLSIVSSPIPSKPQRILHIEESQSDWGQEGRKMGFGGEGSPQYRALQTEAENLRRLPLGQQLEGGKDVQQRLDEIYAQMERVKVAPPSAPFVESTPGWTNLALKRAMIEAAQGNYAGIAWTPGKEQAKRYDLSQHVREIEYIPNGDGTYRLGVTSMQGEGVPLPNSGRMTLEDIERSVGKEIAEKIKSGEGRQYRGHEGRTLEGLDLQVGGQGMVGYYDKIVPTQIGKVLKDINETPQFSSVQVSPRGSNQPVDVPFFEITPAMREKIKEGLPLFTMMPAAVGLGAAQMQERAKPAAPVEGANPAVEPQTTEPREGFDKGGLVKRALNAVRGIRAYHASPKDFDTFKPSEFRGASFFASTPERAKAGAGAGANEMIMETSTVLPPTRMRTYEVEINPTKIRGLHLTPAEQEWIKSAPARIVGDDALEQAMKERPNPYIDWEAIYSPNKIGDRLYEYVKRDELPFISYEDAIHTGRDVYGRQHSHYGAGADEKAAARRVLDQGMGGYLVNDEAGLSIAVADPSIVQILRKYSLPIMATGAGAVSMPDSVFAAPVEGATPAVEPQTTEPREGFQGGGRTEMTPEEYNRALEMAKDVLRQQLRKQIDAANGGFDPAVPIDWQLSRPKITDRVPPQRVVARSVAPMGAPVDVGPGRIGPAAAPAAAPMAYAPVAPAAEAPAAPVAARQQGPVERAMAVVRSVPQAAYEAVSSPVATAQNIAREIFSGNNYQSTGEPIMSDGRINWGDPESAADFFRADKALQEMRPYREDRASGGRLLEDEYPTQYLPDVGRQVMADGGDTMAGFMPPTAAEMPAAVRRDDAYLDALIEASRPRPRPRPQSDADIQTYQRQMRERADMPENIRSMTHAPSKPLRPVEIEGGFTGKRQLGEVPYDVAGPLSGMAQTAYSLKTLPLYFTPAMPLAAASDVVEAGIDTKNALQKGDYLSAALSGGLGVGLGMLPFHKQIGSAVGSAVNTARDVLGRVPAPVAAGAAGAAAMTPAQTQAAAWIGGGARTGLKSDESKPFLKFVEDRIYKTAIEKNMDPQDVMRLFVRGEMPLYANGGSVSHRAMMIAKELGSSPRETVTS